MADTSAGQVSFGWAAEAAEERRQAEPKPARRPKGKAGEQEPTAAKPRITAARIGKAELPPDNELWDVHAAARFLGRSVSWVYHKAEDGTLPVTRLGGWGLRFIPNASQLRVRLRVILRRFTL